MTEVWAEGGAAIREEPPHSVVQFFLYCCVLLEGPDLSEPLGHWVRLP